MVLLAVPIQEDMHSSALLACRVVMKRYGFTGSREDTAIMRVIAFENDADPGVADFARVLKKVLEKDGYDDAWMWYRWQIQYAMMQSVWKSWEKF